MTKERPLYWPEDRIKEWIEGERLDTHYQTPTIWMQHGNNAFRVRRWPSGRYEIVDTTNSEYTDMSSSEFAALLNGFWMGGSISGHAIDNNDGTASSCPTSLDVGEPRP